MKIITGIGLLFIALMHCCSCNPNAASNETNSVSARPDSVQQAPPSPSDSIITGTLRSEAGDELPYTFNNSARTMTIVFKNDTAVLRQDTVASGIRYSGKKYTYTEWHGLSALQQNGKTVFEAGTSQKQGGK